jgi:STAM-binding protein
MMRPKEETLSRHSILGPNGLSGQWQPPITDKGVRQYLVISFASMQDHADISVLD